MRLALAVAALVLGAGVCAAWYRAWLFAAYALLLLMFMLSVWRGAEKQAVAARYAFAGLPESPSDEALRARRNPNRFLRGA